MHARRETVLEMYTALMMAAGHSGSTNYNYAVARNLALLQDEARSIEKAITPSRRFLEWDQKRGALCEKWADRDKDGKPVKDISGGVTKFVITKHQGEWAEDVREMSLEYQAEIDEQNRKNEEDTAFLQEEIEIHGEFRKIKSDEIPRELTGKVLLPLLPMIYETGD